MTIQATVFSIAFSLTAVVVGKCLASENVVEGFGNTEFGMTVEEVYRNVPNAYKNGGGIEARAEVNGENFYIKYMFGSDGLGALKLETMGLGSDRADCKEFHAKFKAVFSEKYGEPDRENTSQYGENWHRYTKWSLNAGSAISIWTEIKDDTCEKGSIELIGPGGEHSF